MYTSRKGFGDTLFRNLFGRDKLERKQREPSREDAINKQLGFPALENRGVPFSNNFNNNFSKVAMLDRNRHPIQTAPGNNN